MHQSIDPPDSAAECKLYALNARVHCPTSFNRGDLVYSFEVFRMYHLIMALNCAL